MRVFMFGIIIIGYLLLFIINAIQNKNFWIININELCSMFLLVYVSYYLVEKNSDIRILKEKLNNILIEIESELDKLIKNVLETKNTSTITMVSRVISNKISLLENYKEKFKIEEDIKYIKDVYKTLDEFIGNHFDNLKSIKQSDLDLFKNQIETRLDEIFKKLF